MAEILTTLSAHVPVTAVGIVGGKHLLSGSGGFVSVYCLTSNNYKLLACVNVLGSRNIHGFVAREENVADPEKREGDATPLKSERGERRESQICAFGERFAVTFRIADILDKRKLQKAPWSLRDRILDARWLNSQENTLAMLLGHNEFELLHCETGVVKSVQCEQRSVLFSGCIVDALASPLVFAGACLGFLYMWRPLQSPEGKVHVQLNLSSTGGVFSVAVADDSKALALACEDRGIYTFHLDVERDVVESWRTLFGHAARIWEVCWVGKHLASAGEDSQVLLWNVVEGTVIHRFKSPSNTDFLALAVDSTSLRLAAGLSDGAVRLFNTKLAVKTSSTERPGDDAAVLIGDATQHVICLRFINETNVIFISKSGNVGLINLKDNTVAQLDADPKYGVAAVLAVKLLSDNRVLLSIAHGFPSEISLFSLTLSENLELTKLRRFPCSDKLPRAYLLFWLSCLQQCGEKPLLMASNFEVAVNCVFDVQGRKVAEFNLAKCAMPPPTGKALKHFDKVAVTCGAHWESPVHGDLFIFGNNCGSVLAVRRIESGSCSEENSDANVIQIFPHVHGRDGCHSVKTVENDSISVITCGGASSICYFRLDTTDPRSPLTLLNTVVQSAPIDFVVSCAASHGREYVCGFVQKSFVLATTQPTQVILAKHFCSGRRREWDLLLSSGAEELVAKFGYVKAGQAFLVESRVSPSEASKEVGLAAPLHSLRIHDCHFICYMAKSDAFIFALASEDATVSIIAIENRQIQAESPGSNLHILHRLSGHISGVRCVKALELSHGTQGVTGERRVSQKLEGVEYLVITGGSRGIVSAWHLFLGSTDISELAKSTFCTKIAQMALTNESIGKVDDLPSSHSNVSKINWRGRKVVGPPLAPDMRFMDVALISTLDRGQFYIMGACSDATVRILRLDLGTTTPHDQGNFALKREREERRETPILLQVLCLTKGLSFCQLKAASLRGEVLISGDTGGNVNLWKWSSVMNQEKEEAISFRIHQSGINALQAAEDDDKSLLVFTGGDDTALVVSKLCSDDNQSWQHQTLFRVESAHSSQISGVSFIRSLGLVCTVSIDQRLRLWRLSASKVEFAGGYVSCVADCSSLAVATVAYEDDDNDKACADLSGSPAGGFLHFLVAGEGCQLLRMHRE